MSEQLIESIIKFNNNIVIEVENNEICKEVKRLLSSLQSVSKRHLIFDNNSKLLSFDHKLITCLTALEQIVFDSSFVETSGLSCLAIGLVLIIYFGETKRAIHLYFKLLVKQSIISIDFNEYKVDSNLSEILELCQTDNDLTKVSLMTGLLNCNYFVNHLISSETKVFFQIHSHIIKVCSERLVHQFHVFRLLMQWFKVFKNSLKELTEKEANILEDKNYLITTLEQIDNNWEHPINGVKDCIKIIYTLILDISTSLSKININRCEQNDDLIVNEVIKSSQMAPTSKAKYRKLSALVQLIGWKKVLELDPNLSHQSLKYLSINSLSTSIIDLYKQIIISMKADKNEDILNIWSQHWLPHVCEAIQSKNKIIHNHMIAHLLPFTLNNVQNSTKLIFKNIKNCSVAEVALIRAAIDNNEDIDFLPPFSWLKQILINSEEIVREEGLCLLIEERYIKDRNKVFELFKLFLLSNLNVDNPSFRQRIISRIEIFLTKVCVSLSDRFSLYGFEDQSVKESVKFVDQYIGIITCNLISGASFQRRTTCLLLLDSLIAMKVKYNLKFINSLDSNSVYFLIILSVIDKDDKVRKMASNLLIYFHKTDNNSVDYDFDVMAEIGIMFLNSPRHQESHSGGLLMKYIINCFKPFKVSDKEISNELEMIEFFVESANNQFNESKINFLNSAKTSPIHGFILALNNSLSYDSFANFCTQKSRNQFKTIINVSIMLCFDCIDLMLSQLSHRNIESSPSFQEMCESLENIIIQQNDRKDEKNLEDISTSNDFQLLLSMCWLNIKECSFLLTNCVELNQQLKVPIISNTLIGRIGFQLVNVLTKCRHKGVIEATCIALTKYTVSLIKMKIDRNDHIQSLKQLLTDSLNCIKKSALTSSITRRSAGVALTVQAILIGESEAYNQGFKLDISLFSLTIDELVEIAKSELPEIIDTKSDLPQTYALHILRSIISTASLSRFTIRTVEFLLPICIKGFSCDVWQIRNASLQLFGSCCTRMLGQRKISDVDLHMAEGSTISSDELFSRYPTLLSAFKLQFESSFKKIDSGLLTPELVPILSLFASFSPICFGETFNDKQVISYLIRLLGNRIWKIRMLSAKALSSLLPINQFENLLFKLCETQRLNCNSIHGLMLSVNHLIELKQQINSNDFQSIKDRFEVIFQKLIEPNIKCYILTDVFQQIFTDNDIKIASCGQELDEELVSFDTNALNFYPFLDEIYSKVDFTNSDDIRLCAAKALNNKIHELLEVFESSHSSELMFKVVSIILVILEDEDKTVRSEAENIAKHILGSTLDNQQILYNVAIDNLLIWLIQNPLIDSQKLTDFLLNKLEFNLSLNQLFELKKQNEILFEKEEKNVFAEPVFQLFRISECLKKVISTTNLSPFDDISLKRLVNDCLWCLQNKSNFELKCLISFSIWKLPKLFLCLSNLFVRIDILFHYFNLKSNETNSLQLSVDNFEMFFAEKKIIWSGILDTNEFLIISETFKLLSNKFPFLSFFKQNSLSGYLLTNYQI